MAKTESWVNKVIDAPEGKLDQYYKEDICDFWDDTTFYVDLDANVAITLANDVTIAKRLLEKTTSGASGHIVPGRLLITMYVLIMFLFDN